MPYRQRRKERFNSIDIYALWAKDINQICNFASQIIALDE
jgi:hypothetical protein